MAWKQALFATVGLLLLTLAFGGLLSVAVNLSLEQLEDRPDLILPGPEEAPSQP